MNQELRRFGEAFTPERYDFYMKTILEAHNFAETKRVIQHLVESQNLDSFSILDFGSGTGLFAANFLLPKVEGMRYTGIEPDTDFLAFARDRINDVFPAKGSSARFLEGNALSDLEDTLDSFGEFDIAVATSVYHHMPDPNGSCYKVEADRDKKVAFLRQMADSIRDGGNIVLYEKFVAPFTDLREQHKVGSDFYQRRIDYLLAEQLDISRDQLDANYKELYMTANRSGEEHKVSLAQFRHDVQKAGLEIVSERNISPRDLYDHPEVGDYVIVLKPM